MIGSIDVRVIPHSDQRYETCGDWWVKNAHANDVSEHELVIRVSDLGDWRMNVLVGVHEIVEAVLCLHDRVNPDEIDAFDKAFEEARLRPLPVYPHGDVFLFHGRQIPLDAEPGDDEDAPYRRQHCIATAVERMLCGLLGVSWNEYERRVLDLPPIAAKA